MSQKDDVYPTEVKLLEEDRELHVTWSDGHVSPFTLDYIRGWCPCATCQGHFESERKFIEVDNPELVRAEPVGNYGMKLVWTDGHDTGIYAFDELRAMCTCEECDPEGERVEEKVRPLFPA